MADSIAAAVHESDSDVVLVCTGDYKMEGLILHDQSKDAKFAVVSIAIDLGKATSDYPDDARLNINGRCVLRTHLSGLFLRPLGEDGRAIVLKGADGLQFAAFGDGATATIRCRPL